MAPQQQVSFKAPYSKTCNRKKAKRQQSTGRNIKVAASCSDVEAVLT